MYFHSHLIIYLQPLNMETAFLYRFHIIQKSRFTKKALETLIHAFILKLFPVLSMNLLIIWFLSQKKRTNQTFLTFSVTIYHNHT